MWCASNVQNVVKLIGKSLFRTVSADNKKFISTKEASILIGRTSDYVGRLAREGKIPASRIGRAWVVEKEGLLSFFDLKEASKEIKKEILSKERKGEYISVQKPEPKLKEKISNFADRISFEGAASFAVAVLIAFGGYSLVHASGLANLPIQIVSTIHKHAGNVNRVFVRADRDPKLAHANYVVVQKMQHEETSVEIENVFGKGFASVHAFGEKFEYEGVQSNYVVAFVPNKNIQLLPEVKDVWNSYVAVGENLVSAAHASTGAYANLVKFLGKASLKNALTARDISRGVSNQVFDSYENGIDTFVSGAQKIPKVQVELVYGFVDKSFVVANTLAAIPYNTGDAILSSGQSIPEANIKIGKTVRDTSPKLGRAIIGGYVALVYNFVDSTYALTGTYKSAIEGVGAGIGNAFAYSRLELPSESLAVVNKGLDAVTGFTVSQIESGGKYVATKLFVPVVKTVMATSDKASRKASELAITASDKTSEAVIATKGNQASVIGGITNGAQNIFDRFFGRKKDPVLLVNPGPAQTNVVIKEDEPIYVAPQNVTRNYFAATDVNKLYVDSSITALHAAVTAELQKITSLNRNQIVQNIETIQWVNKIEDISDTIIRRPEIIGGFLRGVQINEGSTFSGSSVSAGTGTFSTLNAGTTTLTGPLTIPTLVASGTTTLATTTLTGPLTGTTATFTSATTTNATSTNLFATNSTLTNIIGTNATITSATTTNFYASILEAVTATLTNLTATNATTTNATTTNLAISSLTEGSVPFIGTGGLVTEDNSNLFWDSANGRLGIGTTTPDEKLTVLGNGTISLGWGDTEQVGQLSWFGSDAVVRGLNALRFQTNLNEDRLVIDSSGNVGIGTTTPGYLLDVDGDFRVGEAGSSNALFVDATNGNVGIGTNSPSALTSLDVDGNIVLNAAAPVLYLGSDFDQSISANAAANYLSFSTANDEVARIYSNGGLSFGDDYVGITAPADGMIIEGSVGIGTTSPFEKLSVAGNGYFDGTLTATTLTATSSISAPYFTATSASATSTFAGGLTIDSTDFVVDPDGNFVGVGIASKSGHAGERLRVQTGGGNPSVVIDASGSDAATLQFGNSTTGVTGGDGFHVGVDASENAILRNKESTDLIFYTANAETARITSAGNVGVGTSTPGYLLDVDGDFRVGEAGSANAFFVDATNGFVGIGTTTPQDTLHVYSASEAPLIVESTDSISGINLKDSNGDNYLYGWLTKFGLNDSTPDATLEIARSNVYDYLNISSSASGDGDILTVDSTGNVGIGTTTPGSKLSVSGGASIGANYGVAAPSNGLIVEGRVGIGKTNPSYELDVAGNVNIQDSGYFRFNSGDAQIRESGYALAFDTWTGSALTEKVRITGAGNVGIGTTSPYAKLSVVGQAVAEYFTATSTSATSTLPNLSISNLLFGSDYINDITGNGLSVSNGVLNVSTTSLASGFFQQGGNSFGATAVLGTNDSNDLAFETGGSTRVTIDTSGYVGIGTTTPDVAELHIEDSSNNANIGAPQIRLTELGDAREASIYNRNGGLILVTHGADNAVDEKLSLDSGVISLFTGGTERFRINSSGDVGIGTTTPWGKLAVAGDGSGNSLVVADSSGNTDFVVTEDGNVGVGTTTPDTLLHLYANAAATRGLTLQNANTGASGDIYTRWIVGDETQAYTLGIDNSDSDKFKLTDGASPSAGNVFLAVDSSGNVGIGTAAPGAKLEISNGGVIVQDTDFANSTARPSIAGGTTVGDYEIRGVGGTDAGDHGFLRLRAGGGTSANAVSYIDLSGYSTQSDVDKNITFGTAGTERVRIDSSGNVGIGTTSPLSKLNVTADTEHAVTIVGNGLASTSPYTLSVQNNGGDNSTWIEILNGIGGQGAFFGLADSVGDGPGDGDNFQLWNYQGGDIAFYTDPTPATFSGAARLTIEEDGDIGIGAANPSNALHITNTNPTIRLEDSDGSSSIYSQVQSNGQGDLVFIADPGAASGSTQISFELDGSEVGRFNAGGNFGIGETSPGSMLAVSGGATIGSGYDTTAAPTNGLLVEGNVGIGTTTPVAKLTVLDTSAGAEKFVLFGQNSSGDAGTGAGIRLAPSAFSSGGTVRAFDIVAVNDGANTIDLDLRGSSGGSPESRVRITGAGNVGIGTTTPGYLLDVDGDFRVGEAGNTNAFYVDATGNYAAIGTNTDGGEELHIYDAEPLITFNRSGAYTWSIGEGGGTKLPQSYYGIYDDSVNAARLVIAHTTGNVGIGTTTPGYSLDVDGDLNVGEAGNAQAFYVDATAGKVAVGENAHSLTNLGGKGIVISNTAGGATGRLRVDVEDITSGYNTEIRVNDTGLGLEAASNSRSISLWTGASPVERLTVLGTGNVGIGDSTPTGAKLQIAVADDRGIRIDGTGTADGLAVYLAGSNNHYLGYDSDTGNNTINLWQSGDAGRLQLLDGGTVNVSITSDTDSYFNGGSVGIGTTTPQSPFHVYSSTSGNQALIERSSDADVALGFKNSTQEWAVGIDQSDSNTFKIGTDVSNIGNSNKFSLTTGGNLGLGVSAPEELIHIRSGTSPTIRIDNSDSTVSATDVLGAIEFETNDSTATAGISAYINAIAVNSFAASHQRTALTFGTTEVAGDLPGVERLRIDYTGNVGIGTTTPSAKTAITGSGTGTGRAFVVANSSNAEKFTILDNGNVGINTQPGLVYGDTKLQIAADGTYNANAGNALVVTNATSPNKRINFGYDSAIDAGYIQSQENGVAIKPLLLNAGGGSVGIGTTTTYSTVKTRISQSGGSSNIALRLDSYDGGDLLQFSDNVNATGYIGIDATNDHFYLGAAGGSDLVIKNNNVGIGTTTPQNKLHVYEGGGGAVALSIESTGSSASQTIGFTGAGVQRWTLGLRNDIASGLFALRDNAGNNVLTALQGGNVGIGTVSPGDKLHVEGNIYTGTSDTSIYKQGAGNLNIQTNTGDILFSTAAGSTEVVRIDAATGNVGIGTSSPQSILHIEGSGTQAILLKGVGSSDQTIQFGRSDAATNWVVGRDNTNSSFGIGYFTAVGESGLTSASAFSITSGGNVGIGTTTPDERLKLVEEDNAIFSIHQPNATASGKYAQFILTNGPSYFGASDSSWQVAAIGQSDGSSNLAFHNWENGSYAATNILYLESTGNVGIGTTTPGDKLSIYTGNSSNANQGITLTRGSVGAPQDTQLGFRLKSDASGNYRGAITITNGAGASEIEALTIDRTANVGIGTTTPDGKLTVESEGLGVLNTILTHYSDNTPSVIIGRSANGTQASPTAVTDNKLLFTFGVRGHDGTSFVTGNKGVALFTANGDWTGSNNGVDFGIQLTPNGSTSRSEVFTVLGSGNVGIGDTAPGSKLDVAGDINISDTTTGYKIGDSRVLYASSTSFSTIVGIGAGAALLPDGTYNTAIGNLALAFATSSDNNTAIGGGALYLSTTAIENTAVGYLAGRDSTTGSYNTILGSQALRLNTTGAYNTAVGRQALYYNNGLYNTAIGYASTFNNTTGQSNTAVGYASLYNNKTGIYNTAIGQNTLYNNNATSTVAIGYGAGQGIAGAASQNNVFVGFQSGTANATGNNNIFLGYQAGSTATTGDNNIIIGYAENLSSVTASNELNIGGVLYGDLSAGNVGIGTTSPATKFEVHSGTGDNDLYFDFTTSGYPTIGTNYGAGSNIELYDGSTGNLTITAGYSGADINLIPGTTSGNVGIGTENPLVKFQVEGAENTTQLATSVAGSYRLTVGSDSSGNVLLRSNNNLDLRLGTNSGDFLTVKNSGNVGIGETAPAAKLEIRGDSTATTAGGNNLLLLNNQTGNATDRRAGIGFSVYSNGGPTAYIEAVAESAAAETALTFSTHSGGTLAERVRIDNDGNVGVGTTSPNTTLSVDGTFSVTGTSDTGFWISEIAGLTTFLGLNSTGAVYNPLSLRSGSGAQLYLDTDGDVGIGMTNPSVELDVTGDIEYTGTITDVSDERLKENIVVVGSVLDKIAAVNSVTFNMIGDARTQYGFTAQNVQTQFPEVVSVIDDEGHFGVDYVQLISPAFRGIQELNARTSEFTTLGGNVGIGTTTPSYKLHVLGDVAATSFVNISTRESKHGITYLDEARKEDILEKLKAVQIAEYRYNYESDSNPLRLGLIAEEAPSEILSVSGKGVDIYKLATFTLASVQELAVKLETLEERIAALEASGVIAGSGGVFSTTTLQSAFAELGVLIEKGFAQFDKLAFKQLIAEKDTAGEAAAGTGTIYSGNKLVMVENSQIKASSKVFITFTSPVVGSWFITDKANGSFRVTLDQTQTTDVTFDYFIVQTERDAVPTSDTGVIDTEAPSITINGANPYYLATGTTFVDPGVSIIDNVDENLTYTLFVDGYAAETNPLDTSVAGEHLLTYKVIDTAGNLTTETRAVVVGADVSLNSVDTGTTTPPTATTTPAVVEDEEEEAPVVEEEVVVEEEAPADTTAPVVALVGSAAVELTVGDTFTDEGATATDDVDGDLTPVVVGAVDTDTAGLYTLTYTATDISGNEASVSRIVTVVAVETPEAPVEDVVE